MKLIAHEFLPNEARLDKNAYAHQVNEFVESDMRIAEVTDLGVKAESARNAFAKVIAEMKVDVKARCIGGVLFLVRA